MNTTDIKEFLKKNWKSISLVILIGLLIFLNVRQYRENISVYKENTAINNKYIDLQKQTEEINSQISQYKDSINKKDIEIKTTKDEITKTEAKLKVSQSDVRRLSRKILEKDTIKPEEFESYVTNCDSLAKVAPLLSDQVDTLKAQKDSLVLTFEQKSAIKDSIIVRKDRLIISQTDFAKATLKSYNEANNSLLLTEEKLNKEKGKRSVWQKIAIGLGIGVIGILSLK